MEISRTHLIEDLNSSMEGKDVIFGGWVVDLRKLGKMAFLTVRDVTGMCQVIVKGDSMSLLEGLNRQSVVRILGKIQASKAKDFDFEVSATEIQVLAKAEYPLPIDPIGRLESDIDNRLNSRALDMRNQKTASIFKLRSKVLASIRETLIKRKFIEINTPKIIGSASEGGADLFSLDYFGQQAYLAQSPQLYKEQMTIGLERVFEISSFYRAEKSHTGRHLSEFTSVDIEAAMMDYTDVMDVLESIIVDVFKNTSENCKTEQQEIGYEIKVPSSPFERVTYTQALEELGSMDIKIEFGDDLQDSHLRSLGQKHPGFFFLTDWPMKLKPFYIHEKDDDSTLSRSFDLQYGYLELSSGGRRLHDPEQLKSRLKEQDLDPTSFEEHLKTFGWGMPPHSGWGMGLDRLMTVLIGIDNVREVVLYPRDPDRLKP
ncbi:MAG: aspartate--tRNA(Asn) ligase [Thaumarchaeota archaeon]|jgi:aspartyl-tRNA synthetase|nr:aspartate--tRNA(Asn) ligase [Nitrososphaerota archaeon]MBT3743800.1 aspartate--tRNA(Asn) ligase [Nitrososphaerota archaeon]MBT4057097.1 aspartate--tRNA(Asn) ligase [Nitrososphaerota archaeon]MBT4509703.1 aspartate--tRNA(Asn) ligase [Nitrososphaerota archaeon]MBT4675108.1 aspartate--tRNA(Asn) ligase [Nitrososphaerota archaeon]